MISRPVRQCLASVVPRTRATQRPDEATAVGAAGFLRTPLVVVVDAFRLPGRSTTTVDNAVRDLAVGVEVVPRTDPVIAVRHGQAAVIIALAQYEQVGRELLGPARVLEVLDDLGVIRWQERERAGANEVVRPVLDARAADCSAQRVWPGGDGGGVAARVRSGRVGVRRSRLLHNPPPR